MYIVKLSLKLYKIWELCLILYITYLRIMLENHTLILRIKDMLCSKSKSISVALLRTSNSQLTVRTWPKTIVNPFLNSKLCTDNWTVMCLNENYLGLKLGISMGWHYPNVKEHCMITIPDGLLRKMIHEQKINPLSN